MRDRRQTFILATLVAVVTTGLTVAIPPKEGKAEEFDCSIALSRLVGFEIKDIPRISARNPLSNELAESIYSLRFRVGRNTIVIPQNDRRRACMVQAYDAHQGLMEYARRRLSRLLDEQRLEQFQKEYLRLIHYSLDQKECSEIRRTLSDLEPRFLQKLHARLLVELSDSPWTGYNTIPLTLESWTEEWSRLLGREAPAAVDLRNGRSASPVRVAVSSLDYSIVELKIFLFHEITHLVDPLLGKSSAFENEVYAWQETLRFIDELEKTRQNVPDEFSRIRESIRILGLRTWVQSVMRSRTPN